MPLAFKRNQFFGYTAMRRVVRRGSEFICGVCRSSHAGPSHANDCLRSCWSRYTATPVESLKKKSSILWRCRCCHREYSVQEQAGKCALECSGQLKMSYYSLSVTEAEAKVVNDFQGYTMDFEVKSVSASKIIKIIG